jgi:hypothetical protein
MQQKDTEGYNKTCPHTRSVEMKDIRELQLRK